MGKLLFWIIWVGPKYNHWSLYGREAEDDRKKLTTEPEGYVRTEASCYAAGFEDGESGNSKGM